MSPSHSTIPSASFAGLAFALISFTSCATMGPPSRTECVLSSPEGQILKAGPLPMNLNLPASSQYARGEACTLVFRRSRLRDAAVRIEAGIAGWHIGNVVLGGAYETIEFNFHTGDVRITPNVYSSRLGGTDIPISLSLIDITPVPQG